ncbi:MAG: glycosyltransferase family 39 protein [Acidobacteriota bacterium]|nr:glycosyltransferase family 39 protein [Acidobacteriota bacterium]
MTTSKAADPRHWVLLLAALLFAANIWGYDLWAPDEPYFAEGAREMIVDGQWAVPHVNGVVTTDKPALFFWLIALFSLPFGGVSSFTSRLPSVLAAVGTVWLTMRLGTRLADRRTGALAGLILATSFMFWEKARWTQIDSTLCFLIWVALTALVAFRAEDADGRRAGLLFWAAVALAGLAKGPIGLILILGISLVTLGIDRDLRAWRRFSPVRGPILFAAIVGLWAVIVTIAGPDSYSILEALREHVLERGLHGMHHEQPWYYFFKVLPVLLLPWSGLIPGALLLAWRRRDPSDRFLLAVVIVVITVFSISVEKRELYALPAFPAFALLSARFIAHELGWARSREVSVHTWWLRAGLGAVAVLVALVGAVLGIRYGDIELVGPGTVALLSGVVLLTGLSTLIFLWRRRLSLSVASLAGGFVVLYLLAAFAVFPALEPRKSARSFAARVATLTAQSRAAGERVVAFDLGNLPEPLAFYSGGLYTVETNDLDRLRQHMVGDAEVFAAVNSKAVERLPEDLTKLLYVADRILVTRYEVLVVSNRPAPERTVLSDWLAAPAKSP